MHSLRFTDNEVDGFSLLHLTESDLKEILPGKMGVVRKLLVLLARNKVIMLAILNLAPACKIHCLDSRRVIIYINIVFLPCACYFQPGASSSSAVIEPDHDSPEDGHNMSEEDICAETSSTPSTTMIPLPKYSERVKMSLTKGEIMADFDAFVEETAFHIMARGDMKTKGEYQDYGYKLVTTYPCLEFPGHKEMWVCTFTAW